MPVNLILALPESLVHCLFTEWIGPDDLVRLDTALCVRSFRPKLFQIQTKFDWQGLFAERSAYTKGSRCFGACQWITKNGFCTSQISFNGADGSQNEDPVKRVIISNALHIKCATTSSNSIMQCLSEHCSALESLSCSFCSLNAHFETLLANNPSLQELQLDSSRFHPFSAILERIRCPNVTKLCIWHDVTTHLAGLIVKAFPNVTDLLFDSIEDDALRTLTILPLRALTLLDIVTFDGAIFEDTLEDHYFSDLRELTVCCWSEDAVISSFLTHSPKLHTVRLTNLDEDGNIHGRGILHLLSSHVGARLEVLYLEFVHDLPDQGLKLLALCCPNLRELWVRECDNDFTDETLLKLLSRCPKLARLHVHRLKCTTSVLEAVVEHCPLMHTLTFDCGEIQVDEDDLVVFVRGAKALRVFALAGAEFPGDANAFTAAYCGHLKFTVGGVDDDED